MSYCFTKVLSKMIVGVNGPSIYSLAVDRI